MLNLFCTHHMRERAGDTAHAMPVCWQFDALSFSPIAAIFAGLLPPAATQPGGAAEYSTAGSPGAAAHGRPRVCILGGGFGGLYAAVRLESLFWPEGCRPVVTLIDQNDRFIFKPLMYELLNGSATEDEVCPQYTQVLAPFQVRAPPITQGQSAPCLNKMHHATSSMVPSA